MLHKNSAKSCGTSQPCMHSGRSTHEKTPTLLMSERPLYFMPEMLVGGHAMHGNMDERLRRGDVLKKGQKSSRFKKQFIESS